MSSHAGLRTRPLDPVVTLPALRLRTLAPLLLGAGLAAAALVAKGGTTLGPATSVAIAVTLVGAGVAIYAQLFAPTPQRRWGGVTLALLAGLTAWTALSIAWSVAPADSWAEANRTVAYLAAFAGALGIARLAPERGRTIIAAVLVACLTVCVVAMFDKAFPAVTNSTAELARLREPLGYWNALGLLAAMAVPAALWLGARREGTALGRATAYPLLGIALVTLLFAYSRGALAALLAGLVVWFAIVPLRLRSLVVLVSGCLGAGAITAWAFSQDALSEDRQPLAERIAAGHSLALLLVAMILLLLAAGLAVQWARENHPPSPGLRRACALAALCAAALVPVVALGALAASERGLGGSVSQAWNSFFATSATAPSYGPDRLTATGSKRGAYWSEAQAVWNNNRIEGAGAGGYATARLRYRQDTVDVRHAHGYLPQTAADLGIVGVLLSLALLAAWAIAARRSTRRPGPDPWAPAEQPVWRTPGAWPGALAARGRALAPGHLNARLRSAYERAGAPAQAQPAVETARVELMVLVVIVVIFGLHSAIDWTWAFPGTALVALVCAGYVAGHGPLAAVAARRSAPVQGRTAAAVAIGVIALATVWAIWQPQRAQAAVESSAALLVNQRTADARLLAQTAARRDPVSPEPLFQWADVEAAARQPRAGVIILERAQRAQPQNPDTWRALGQYQLDVAGNPSGAYQAFRAALRLDPLSPTLRASYSRAYERLPRRGAAGQPPPRASRTARRQAAKRADAGAAGTSAEAVARCRQTVSKLQGQLNQGGLAADKAAKKRTRLRRCQQVIAAGG